MEQTVNVPKFFLELRNIPAFKHAVIAGGFLRDQFLKIPSKDVDVFIPVQSFNTFRPTVEDTLKDMFVELNFDAKTKNYEEGGLKFCKFDGITKDGYEVDLIGVKTGVEHFGQNLIETFPFGNQQVYTTGKKALWTPRFEEDILDNTMTLVNCKKLANFPSLYKKFKELEERTDQRLVFRSDYILTKRDGDDWL